MPRGWSDDLAVRRERDRDRSRLASKVHYVSHYTNTVGAFRPPRGGVIDVDPRFVSLPSRSREVFDPFQQLELTPLDGAGWTVHGRQRVDQGLARLTPENLITESQHSAVAACKGGWVAIDLRSTVGLASLSRSGRGRPRPGMLAKACSIASAASRSLRSPRKRPVTCRPKGIACSSIPLGMEIAGLVTSVTT